MEVDNYLSAVKGMPFFYIVGDSEYSSALSYLKQKGAKVIRISDFCFKDDKFPNIDELIDYFRTSDIDYRNNKFVVVGLGEYLGLRGSEIAEKELRRLKTLTLGNARVVILLRGIHNQAIKLINEDKRIIEQQRAYISENVLSDISITQITKDIGIVHRKGIKNLLKILEDGASGNLKVCSSLFLDSSLFSVSTFSDVFSIVKHLANEPLLKKEYGSTEQWERFLNDLQNCNYAVSEVFEKNNIKDFIENDFKLAVSGIEYKNWLVFLYFKLSVRNMSYSYLQVAIEKSEKFSHLKKNLLLLITEYTHYDKDFLQFYNERKRLVKDFPEEDIAIFMKTNEIDNVECIYRYTDNTLLEKKAIVKWISLYGLTDAIAIVYPALDVYLKKYSFSCNTLSNELTEYFNSYKRLKVTNHISDEFMSLVEFHAQNYSYTKFPTRNNAIKAIKEKDTAYLYWIDALGVEYLSYITFLARKKGLSIHIDITRSDLPTITDINKGFYDEWVGKKHKESRLDYIKHKKEGGYFFDQDETPIHIPAELQVIEDALNRAAYELSTHSCKSFIIASDHGASRLAVIKKQEIKYETETKGEHSGRCCKYFQDCDVSFKFEENDYIVLSDYGRFKKSREANVEVHGGGSLEEIIVPIITLTLKKQGDVIVKVIHPNDIVADRHGGVELTLYISDIENEDMVNIEVEDTKCRGISTDGQHFVFQLTEFKRSRSKPYSVSVFDGADLVGTTQFTIKGKQAIIDDDFNFGDDLQ